MLAGLIIPTTMASIPAAADQTETFCGLYLNPIANDVVAGTAVGENLSYLSLMAPGTSYIFAKAKDLTKNNLKTGHVSNVL